MKKVCLFLLAGLCAFAMVACSDGGGGSDNSSLSLALDFSAASGRAATARAPGTGETVYVVVSGAASAVETATIGSDGTAVVTVDDIPVGGVIHVAVASRDADGAPIGNSVNGYTVKSGSNVVSVSMKALTMSMSIASGSGTIPDTSGGWGIQDATADTVVTFSISPGLTGAKYTWTANTGSLNETTTSPSVQGAVGSWGFLGATGTTTCVISLGGSNVGTIQSGGWNISPL